MIFLYLYMSHRDVYFYKKRISCQEYINTHINLVNREKCDCNNCDYKNTHQGYLTYHIISVHRGEFIFILALRRDILFYYHFTKKNSNQYNYK